MAPDVIRRRWLAAVAFLLALAGGLYYADLLAAAVAVNPFPHSAQSVARGGSLWKQDCEACHGVAGRGDGPVSASLRKRPKDLTRIESPPIFPDGVLAYRIANGGEVMPAWKGALSGDDIWDLVNFIRAQHR